MEGDNIVLEKINAAINDATVSTCFRLGSAMMPIVLLAQLGIPSILTVSALICISFAVVMIVRFIYVIIKNNAVRNQELSDMLSEMLALPYCSILQGLIFIQNTDDSSGLIMIGMGLMVGLPVLARKRKFRGPYKILRND